MGFGRTLSLSSGDYTARYNPSSPPSPPKNTPFDNFITAYINGNKSNEAHVHINNRNGGWMAEEMEGTPLVSDCNVYCDAAVTGSSTICGSAQQYSFNITLPQGASVSWTAIPSGKVSLSQSGNNVTATPVSYGTVTLRATITSGTLCGTIILEKTNITVSIAPSENTLTPSYSTYGYSNWLQDVNCLKTYTFPGMWSGDISLSDPVATLFEWTFISKYPSTATAGISYTDPRYATVTVKPDGAWAIYRLTLSNDCGSYSHDYKFVADGICVTEGNRGLNDSPSDISIAPNPTIGTFTISINSIKNFLKIREIIIMENTGIVIKRVKAKTNSHTQTINIENLPAGVYVIRVFDGSKWLMGKVIKQ